MNNNYQSRIIHNLSFIRNSIINLNSDPLYSRGESFKCKQVVLSDRAYASIIAETGSRIETETGGIFLGQIRDGIWYVIEVLDPGPQSVFRTAYFEYDQDYVNYLGNKVNQIYQQPLILLGLWHRHPSSLDSFSSTDDETNLTFAQLNQEYGAISGLVNIDPKFRLTMYHVDSPLSYTKVAVEVGNKLIPDDLMQLKKAEDVALFFPTQTTYSSELNNQETSLTVSKEQNQDSYIEINQRNMCSKFEEILAPQWNFLSSLKDYNSSIKYDSLQEQLIITFEPKCDRYIHINQNTSVAIYFNQDGLAMIDYDGKSSEYYDTFFNEYISKLDQKLIISKISNILNILNSWT